MNEEEKEPFWEQELQRSLVVLNNLGIEFQIFEPVRYDSLDFAWTKPKVSEAP